MENHQEVVCIDVCDLLDRIYAQRWLNLGFDCCEDGTFQAAFTLSSKDKDKRYAPPIESPIDRRANLFSACETFGISSGVTRWLDLVGVRSVTLLSLLSRSKIDNEKYTTDNFIAQKEINYREIDVIHSSIRRNGAVKKYLWRNLWRKVGCELSIADEQNLINCVVTINETPLEPLYSLKRLISQRAFEQKQLEIDQGKYTLIRNMRSLSYLDLALTKDNNNEIISLLSRRKNHEFNDPMVLSVSNNLEDVYMNCPINTLHSHVSMIAKATFQGTSGSALGKQRGSRDFFYLKLSSCYTYNCIESVLGNLKYKSPSRSPQKKIRKMSKILPLVEMKANKEIASSVNVTSYCNQRLVKETQTSAFSVMQPRLNDASFVSACTNYEKINSVRPQLGFENSIKQMLQPYEKFTGDVYNTPRKTSMKIDSPLNSPTTTHRVVLVPYFDGNTIPNSPIAAPQDHAMTIQDSQPKVLPILNTLISSNLTYPTIATQGMMNEIPPILPSLAPAKTNIPFDSKLYPQRNAATNHLDNVSFSGSTVVKELFPAAVNSKSQCITSNSIQDTDKVSLYNKSREKNKNGWSNECRGYAQDYGNDSSQDMINNHHSDQDTKTEPPCPVKSQDKYLPTNQTVKDKGEIKIPNIIENTKSTTNKDPEIPILSHNDKQSSAPRPIFLSQQDPYGENANSYYRGKRLTNGHGEYFKDEKQHGNRPFSRYHKEIHESNLLTAACPYVFCNKNIHHSLLRIGNDILLHLKEYHPSMIQLPITIQGDCNLEQFSIPLGYLTYGMDEYKYRIPYSKEGIIHTKFPAKTLLDRNHEAWWWGPWGFPFDGMSFYLTLYRNDEPFVPPKWSASYYQNSHRNDRRICFLVRANCEGNKANRYAYRVRIYDPKQPDEISLSDEDESKFFVGEVQSLEETYEKERRLQSSKNIQLQRDEFLHQVSRGHIVHYWQSFLNHRVCYINRVGYIKYKIIIYRKEDMKHTTIYR